MRLDELLKAAESEPQTIRSSSGELLILHQHDHGCHTEQRWGISEEAKEYLLTAGTGPADDPLDEYM